MPELAELLPEGWTAERLQKGKIGIWDADGHSRGIWRDDSIRQLFENACDGI